MNTYLQFQRNGQELCPPPKKKKKRERGEKGSVKLIHPNGAVYSSDTRSMLSLGHEQLFLMRVLEDWKDRSAVLTAGFLAINESSRKFCFPGLPVPSSTPVIPPPPPPTHTHTLLFPCRGNIALAWEAAKTLVRWNTIATTKRESLEVDAHWEMFSLREFTGVVWRQASISEGWEWTASLLKSYVHNNATLSAPNWESSGAVWKSSLPAVLGSPSLKSLWFLWT